MFINFLKEEIFIVTHNVDGINYCINCSKEDLFFDYWGDCNFVPENDANVFLFFYKNEEVRIKSNMIFEDVVQFLNKK